MSRTFGVEIEMVGNISPARVLSIVKRCGEEAYDVRRYGHTADQVVSWELKRDHSVTRGKYGGLELVSPILQGLGGYSRLASVVSGLNRWMATARGHESREIFNQSTGLHVHIGIRDFTKVETDRLVWLWGKFQGLVFSFLHPARKSSDYCHPISVDNLDNTGYNPYTTRRSSLNLTNWPYVGAKRGTAEFRLHHGTADVQAIVNFVRLCESMVERCKRPLNISKTTKVWTMARLARILGWSAKDAPRELVDARDYWLSRVKGTVVESKVGWIEPGTSPPFSESLRWRTSAEVAALRAWWGRVTAPANHISIQTSIA